MRSVPEQMFDQVAGVGSDLHGPVKQASGSPFQMGAMRSGHVFGISGMRALPARAHMEGHALTAMKEFDGLFGQAHVELFAQE